MTEKRFDIQFDGVKYFCVVDVPNERGVGRFDTIGDAKGYLELYEYYIDVEEELQKMKKENEQLKKENRELEKFRYSVFKNLHEITEKEYRE